MRARPPKARPDTLRAHSSVLLKRHAPGMTLAPSGGAQRPLRHTQRPAGRLPGGRHYAAKPRKRRRAPGGGMFFACVAVVILSLSWVITTLIELPAKRAAASQFGCFVGFSGCFLSGRRQRGADRGSGAWPCTANRRFVYTAFRFTGGAAGGGAVWI